jgi:predicted PurR-regulated permease PerM
MSDLTEGCVHCRESDATWRHGGCSLYPTRPPQSQSGSIHAPPQARFRPPLLVAGEKAFYRVAVILMIVGSLYWAQVVFLPLALAVLFAFALSPVAGWPERRRLGRIPAALISTAAAIGLIAGVLAVAEQQTERLVLDLRGDAYQKNLSQKLARVGSLSN